MTQPPPDPATLAAPPLPEGPKTSGLAIASLICGIAGLCTCGLGGLVGLVLSLVAMGRIRRSRGELGGRGIALAGLIVSIIAGALALIHLAIFLGIFAEPLREWARAFWEQAREGAEEDPGPFFGEELNRAPDFPERRPAAPWLAPVLEERRLAFAAVAAVPAAIASGRRA